jgi:hypothetical protein
MPTMILILAFQLAALTLPAYNEQWQISLPISVSSFLNDADRSSMDLNLGLSTLKYFPLKDRLFYSLGLGLNSSWPNADGNSSVMITRQSAFTEFIIMTGKRWQKENIAISPTLGLKAALGAIWYKRQALRTASRDLDLLFWFGPSLGISYWIKNWAFSISYDLSFAAPSLRQALQISLGISV